jgi:hypothetical protein
MKVIVLYILVLFNHSSQALQDQAPSNAKSGHAQVIANSKRQKMLLNARARHVWATASSRQNRISDKVEEQTMSFEDVLQFGEMRKELAGLHGRIGVSLVRAFSLSPRELVIGVNHSSVLKRVNASIFVEHANEKGKRLELLNAAVLCYEKTESMMSLVDATPRHVFDRDETALIFDRLASAVDQIEEISRWLVADSSHSTIAPPRKLLFASNRGVRYPEQALRSSVFVHFHLPKVSIFSLNCCTFLFKPECFFFTAYTHPLSALPCGFAL